MRRPSRASGTLEEEEEEETSLFRPTPAAWSCRARSTRGPACSPPPQSPPAPGSALAQCTSLRVTAICTLCRLSICQTRCLTCTRGARTSPRLTSKYPRYRRRQRLLFRRPAIGGKRGVSDSQESSQVRSWDHLFYDQKGKKLTRLPGL